MCTPDALHIRADTPIISGMMRDRTTSSGAGIAIRAVDDDASGYSSGSIRNAFSASARSCTRWAHASIDKTVIDIESGMWWSIAVDTRSSCVRFLPC